MSIRPPASRSGFPTAAPATGAAGPSLPGLQVGALIGRGAGTTVYRACRDGVEYAVKILDTPPPDPGQVLASFRREAALLAGVDHPQLPAVHEVGHVDGRPYLVMDLVGGRPLTDVLRDGRLDPGRAVRLLLDVLGPLACLHAAGVVHRDLKPHNILVRDDGSARLIDFGLAVHAGSPAAEPAPASLVAGTLAYASPEQAGTLRLPVDHRADLYSLGVVLFECLTGILPFATTDVGELLRLHATEPAPDPRSLVPVGAGLAAVVGRLLAKDPDDRYRSAGTLTEDLARLAVDPGAEVGGPRRAGGTAPARSGGRLCGRAVERAALAGYWRRARAGIASSCLLTGPTGGGLTRLAAEIGELARADGATVLELACRGDGPVPFGTLRAAVEAWLGEVDDLPADQRTAEHARIRAAAGPGSLLAHLSPRLGEIVGTTDVADAGGQDGFVTAAAAFLAELGRSGPGMLILIDDAPLLDPGSEQVLARLVGHASLLMLATVCVDRAGCSRSAGVLAWLRERTDAELDLQPLEDEDVVELVTNRLPGVDVGCGLARLLARRCQGNPLIIVEYLRAVVDAGLLSPGWGRWRLDVDGLNALELPADVLGLVAARMDRLDDADRRMLTVAAVIGTSFGAEVLADVAGIDVDHATTALAFAAAEQLVGTDGDGDGAEYQFLHAQIRTALLDEVGEAELARLHHAVAEALERRCHAPSAQENELVFAVASHYLAASHPPAAGSPPPGERARAMWTLAGRLALAGYAPAQAVTYLEAAADAGPAETGLTLVLATAYVRDGRFADARRRLDDALVAERDPTRRAQIRLLGTEVERDSWNDEQAWSTARRGLAELGCLPPTGRVARTVGAVLRLVLGLLIVLCGRGGSARAAARPRAAVTCELHRAAGYLAVINGQPHLQLLHALYAVPALTRLGSGPEYALGIGSLGVVSQAVRLTRLSERLLRRAEAAAVQIADPQVTALVEWYRSISAHMSGADDGERWQQAVERHGQWYEAGQVCAAIATFVWDAGALGDIALARSWFGRSRRLVSRSEWASTPLPVSAVVTMTAEGRPVEAAAELDRIEATAGGPPPRLQVIVLMARLHALVEQGEFGRPFDEVVDRFTAIGPKPGQMIRQFRIFLVHAALGRLEQWRAAVERDDAAAVATARAVARRAVRDLVRTAGAPNEIAWGQLARAESALLDGHPHRALRLLGQIRPVRQVAPILELERARSTARALAAAGYPVPARSQARVAMVLAAEAGLARRAHAVAREFGLDPSTGPGSLGSAGWASGSGSSGIDKLRLEALQEISLAASTVLDRGELARICLDRTLRILTAERAVLFLLPDGDAPSDGREPLVPYLGRDDDGRDVARLTGYSASLVERVRSTGELVVVTGTEEGAALGAQSVVVHGLRSIMVAPLQLEGRLLGVVYLDSQVARGIFTAEDAGILTALTTHIATALETARAAELEVSVRTARRQRDFAEALRARSEEMAAAPGPQEVLGRLAAAVPTTFPGVDSVLLAEGDPELGDVELRALLDGRRAVTGRGPAPRAVAERHPVGAAWSIHPLVAADRSVGLLVLHAGSAEALSQTEIDLAEVLIGQAMTVFERASLFSRVQELAVMDELTGVANRRRFFEVAERDLAAAQLHDRPMHAMMIDIDHFKRVNDSYGHPVGDEVIRAVAQRLRHQTRETDILGRYGGEEFALVLSDVGEIAEFAERLRSTVGGEPVRTQAGPLPITVSIGMAARRPSDTSVADVLARADAALYEAKRAGRNRVVGDPVERSPVPGNR